MAKKPSALGNGWWWCHNCAQHSRLYPWFCIRIVIWLSPGEWQTLRKKGAQLTVARMHFVYRKRDVSISICIRDFKKRVQFVALFGWRRKCAIQCEKGCFNTTHTTQHMGNFRSSQRADDRVHFTICHGTHQSERAYYIRVNPHVVQTRHCIPLHLFFQLPVE